MPIGITFDVHGHAAILKRLKKLPIRLRKQAITRAGRIAMRPILIAARANAPKGETGTLRKSIRLRALKRESTKTRWAGVRVATSDVWYTGPEFYAAFQEFGWHSGRRTNAIRKGIVKDTRKWNPGQHYLEETYKAHGDRALKTFFAVLPKEIEKLVTKLATEA